jgi:hypothetical protein
MAGTVAEQAIVGENSADTGEDGIVIVSGFPARGRERVRW